MCLDKNSNSEQLTYNKMKNLKTSKSKALNNQSSNNQLQPIIIEIVQFKMKPSKRMNTNATSQSNKKQSRNGNQNSLSFQLPKIQKSSNYQTSSNLSYDVDYASEKQGHLNGLSDILENQREEFGVVNYEKMTMEEIKHQFHRLREEVNTLNSEIKNKQELYQSKIIRRSRVASSMQTQKKLAQTEKQLYQNSLLLFKLRQQYQQLDKRSNLANSSISRPNAQLNEKLLGYRQKILNVKEKIKLLRRKTKKSGQDIVNGENIHEVLERMQRQDKALSSKLANLQGKFDESRFKIQRQDEKLTEIQKAHIEAEDYLKLFKLQNEQVVEKSTLQRQWRLKQHKQEVIRKKIESDQQTYLQKYHQLLKLFELQSEKEQKLGKKLIDQDIRILKARNSILDLEKDLADLEEIVNTFKQQQEMKKEADILRRVIQAQDSNETFMTENGLAMTSQSINNHYRRVQSIEEENESEIRDTIEMSNDEKQQNHNKNHYAIKNHHKPILSKMEEKQLENFVNQTRNSTTLTVKDIQHKEPQGIKDFGYGPKDSKYYLSNKEIAKRREDQKNMSTLRKQQSHNDVKTGRRIQSLIKSSNDSTKLRELAMNRSSNKGTKALVEQERKQVLVPMIPFGGKQGYIKNGHEKEIEKGKQILRERKNSEKMQSRNYTKEIEYPKVEGDMLEQLQKISKQLLESQQNNNNNRRDGRIERGSDQIKEKGVKPESKEGRIRKQNSNLIRPQVMEQIDQKNIEYSRKIQQLKKQINNNQINSFKPQPYPNQKNSIPTLPNGEKDTIQINQKPKQLQKPKSLQKAKSLQQKIDQPLDEIAKHEHPNPSSNPIHPKQTIYPVSLQQNKQQQSMKESLDLDDDIDEDISQINRMIKKKLQNQQINNQ